MALLVTGAVAFACSGSTFTGTDPSASGAGGKGATGGSGGSQGGKGGKGGASGSGGTSTGGSAGNATGGTDSSGGSDDTGGTGGTGGSSGRGGGSSGGNGGSGNDGGTGGGSGGSSGSGGSGNAAGIGGDAGSSSGSGGSGNTSGGGGVSGGGAGGALGGAGGALGGAAGTGNQAGAGGKAGAECQTAADCVMVSDCCTCESVPKGKGIDACPAVCIQDACAAAQIDRDEVACVFGRCVLARSCDLSEVGCEAALPVCPEGRIPSVNGTCYGPCLPPTECSRVTSCADCANPSVCVRNEAQLQTYGCVLPDQGCAKGSYCSCLDACVIPFDVCMEAPAQVNCTCPNC